MVLLCVDNLCDCELIGDSKTKTIRGASDERTVVTCSAKMVLMEAY